MTLLGSNSRIVAASSERFGEMVPAAASDELMMQVRQGRQYVTLDPVAGGGYVVRTAVQVPRIAAGRRSAHGFSNLCD